jgi:hypothetical protein
MWVSSFSAATSSGAADFCCAACFRAAGGCGSGRLGLRSGFSGAGRRGAGLFLRGRLRSGEEILRGEQHEPHEAEGEQETLLHAHFAAGLFLLAAGGIGHPFSWFS